MQFPRSGVTGEALTTSATDVRSLLGLNSTLTEDRVLFLRAVWAYNSHAANADTLTLWDVAEGAGPAAATQRLSVPLPALTLTMVEFPAPGLKFVTNLTASLDNSPAAGTVAVYEAGATGYEDGA